MLMIINGNRIQSHDDWVFIPQLKKAGVLSQPRRVGGWYRHES